MQAEADRNSAQVRLPTVAPATRAALRRRLAGWYDGAKRDLPWRRTRDPYAIWVSEVMLQQTRVETVEPYFDRFMRRFPDVASLARARRQTLLKVWEGLGYYARARNMHRTARRIVEENRGRLPDTWDALRRLPGIGDYIAAAVLSIAHDAAYAVVDGNVKRVLARLFCLDWPVNRVAAHKSFQMLADELLDRSRPGDHNQAVMELGALVCTPRDPGCATCPLIRFCRAGRNQCTAEYPRRETRKALPLRHRVAAAVTRYGRLLLTRRPAEGLLGGLWELPGGDLGPGEDGAVACAARIGEILGLAVEPGPKLATIRHTYTHFKLRLDLYACPWRGGFVTRNGPAAHRWVTWDEIGRLPLHGAMHKALPHIEKILQS